MNGQTDVGKLASSLAGHDKNKVYLIVREEGNFFWLADGKSRRLDSPKKKKRKHVQLINHYPLPALTEGLQKASEASDSEIRKLIRAYEKSRREQTGNVAADPGV